jgi:5-bromo-4-chloroindolyl phosphate hydrolysis protein
MNNDRHNLVSLEQWKHHKRESGFSDYLKVLSFSDLVNESNHLATEIKRQQATDHLLSRTKLMMNELTHRLERESKILAHTVVDLKKQIEDRISDRE